jgi:hypothetical protein
MNYSVTAMRCDTRTAIAAAEDFTLASALKLAKSLYRTHHQTGIANHPVAVPPDIDFNDWADVDRLRHGSTGPFFPVHVDIRSREKIRPLALQAASTFRRDLRRF